MAAGLDWDNARQRVMRWLYAGLMALAWAGIVALWLILSGVQRLRRLFGRGR
jgi:hypothetical protein